MWPHTFDARLKNWYALRTECQTLPIETALKQINQWWFGCPWRPYYLHWDEQHNWPDPWQLLSDDVYCEVARALGILYTISLLDRADMADAELVLTEDGSNLVQVAKEKYILNWNPDSIVNTFQEVKIKRQYQKKTNSITRTRVE
jgi:hypothetical protein